MFFKIVKSIVLSLIALLFLVSVSFAQETSTHEMTEGESTEVSSASGTNTSVVLITDPEIAAVEDEEPDCE